MTDDKKKTTDKTEEKKDQKEEKKTLSVGGGTLSVGGTLSASSSARSSGGPSIEVRRRRDFSNQKAQVETPQSGELSERARVLEQARLNAEKEAKLRDEERKRLEALKKEQTQDVQKKKTAEEERRFKAEEEKRKEEEAKRKAEEERIVKEQAAAQPAEKPEGTVRRESTGRKPERDDDYGKKRGGRNAYVEDLEARFRATSRYARQNRKQTGPSAEPKEKLTRDVTIPEAITVSELAGRMSERVGDVVKQLMGMGQMVTQNQIIDQETAALIVEEMGHRYTLTSEADIEENLVPEEEDEKKLITRPPVVTVMGHVDHGKTTLLDTIRKARVADKEAGGITQHIGAYQVTNKDGREITFIDTPGHAAFTSMRARGAAVTDVVILIVAADDGVMPQTIEAIKHAKAADVPIIVAVNKCDKPEANPDRVKQELLNYELVSEEYGGETIFVHISAKAGTGIEELEEMILLQADILELKANPERQADGVVVESQLDKGRGPVATVIVKGGSLKVGDTLVAGNTWGRVRALNNDRAERVEEAGPAMPVEIIGLQGVPEAGETFAVVESEKKAREVAGYRDKKRRDAEQAAKAGSRTLESLLAQETAGQKQLGVVVKGDVQGSVEAIAESLEKQATDEVAVSAIHSAVGVITESDVMLASASNAIIIGFNVRASSQARELAEREGIEIRYYSIIYNLIDDVRAAMTGLLAPSIEENIIGLAEVRETYKVSKLGTIAGCKVSEGVLRRNAKCRVIRDGVVLHEGEIDSLKRFKDDAKEVQAGFECGLTVTKFDDIREGDEIECFEMVERAVSLDELREAAEKKAKEDKKAAKEAAAAEAAAELESQGESQGEAEAESEGEGPENAPETAAK